MSRLHIYCFANALDQLHCSDTCEAILRSWLGDFISRRGRVTRPRIPGDEALAYLIAERSGSYDEAIDLLARPTELGSVLLAWSACFNMDENVGPYLEELEHLPLNIYIPSGLHSFSNKHMEDGANIAMQIGAETGFGLFCLEDLRKLFERFCTPRLQQQIGFADDDVRAAAMLASLIMLDRVPWHKHNSLKRSV
jgi:hypothetical protein